MGEYKINFHYKNGKEKVLYYNRLLGKFYDIQTMIIIPSPELNNILDMYMSSLETSIYNTYGLLLPWDDVDEISPLMSNAKIIDIYSGATFMVQRRAGSSHADCQPLTAQDTATMKKIFNGSWTWDRSGIVVEIDGYRIAGSMSGKPHGAGKIDDNNFPGHFCIHFQNSTTHSGNMDLRHHQEILKAAGKLPLE